LGEVEVVLILGVDVGDAPLVAEHFDAGAEAGEAHRFGGEGQGEKESG
jgi:hypothetical protein